MQIGYDNARGAGIPPEQAAEIAMLVEQIERFDRGESDPEDFRRFRLENGIYGIRGCLDQHMVRVKVRFGRLTPGQLAAMAGVAEDFTSNRAVHLTTRQDVQFHFVRRHSLPAVLTTLSAAGLTTREACGNTVRNVTACPYAGISPTEVFDVRPYADAVSLYFLRNPANQNLPRKFKIAFEGCTEDHARIPIHDFGAVAALRAGERGFRIYLGGGLGAQPASAKLLEDFTPEDLLIPTAEAVLRIFDRYGERRGDRAHRMRARLKFLIRERGWEEFRKSVLEERQTVLLTRSGRSAVRFELEPESPPFGDDEIRQLVAAGLSEPTPMGERYDRWRSSNVIGQKQNRFSAVIVRAPFGDLSARDLRQVARIAARYCAGRIQAAVSQNLLLRWVADPLVPRVYRELERAGLAHGGAHQLADVTRCPGADTCRIAITRSRGLAEALVPIVEKDALAVPELEQLSIKISGCMNACGHHHIADLGFYGTSQSAGGHDLPKYTVMLGGRTREGLAEFGVPVAQVPARLAPVAIEDLLRYYRENRQQGESFRDFVQRTGKAGFRSLLSKYQAAVSYTDHPELFRDLGVEEEFQTAASAAGTEPAVTSPGELIEAVPRHAAEGGPA